MIEINHPDSQTLFNASSHSLVIPLHSLTLIHYHGRHRSKRHTATDRAVSMLNDSGDAVADVLTLIMSTGQLTVRKRARPRASSRNVQRRLRRQRKPQRRQRSRQSSRHNELLRMWSVQPLQRAECGTHQASGSPGLCYRELWQGASQPIAITPTSSACSDRRAEPQHGRRDRAYPCSCADVPRPGQQDGLPRPSPAHRLRPGTSHLDSRKGQQADAQVGREFAGREHRSRRGSRPQESRDHQERDRWRCRAARVKGQQCLPYRAFVEIPTH